MFALEHVGLRSTGSLNGNISTVRVSMQDGAVFNGRVGEAQPVESAAVADNKVLEARYSRVADIEHGRGQMASAGAA
jgi:cytoskeletal protein CcmA (bactofilin family)